MTNFQKVKKFMETFGQEVKSKSSFSSEKINELRFNLIKEELDEFRQALENNDLLEAADALIIALEIFDEINRSSRWTMAALRLMIAIDLIIDSGTYILPILKYFFDLWVDAPQYLSFGTLIPPMLSNSFLVFIYLNK